MVEIGGEGNEELRWLEFELSTNFQKNGNGFREEEKDRKKNWIQRKKRRWWLDLIILSLLYLVFIFIFYRDISGTKIQKVGIKYSSSWKYLNMLKTQQKVTYNVMLSMPRILHLHILFSSLLTLTHTFYLSCTLFLQLYQKYLVLKKSYLLFFLFFSTTTRSPSLLRLHHLELQLH